MIQSGKMRYIFYRSCSVWCYEHKKFENIMRWCKHNNEEFIAIQETLLDKYIIKRIGNIEFLILPREGMISPDRILDKNIEKIMCNCVLRLLKNDGIYVNTNDLNISIDKYKH